MRVGCRASIFCGQMNNGVRGESMILTNRPSGYVPYFCGAMTSVV